MTSSTPPPPAKGPRSKQRTKASKGPMLAPLKGFVEPSKPVYRVPDDERDRFEATRQPPTGDSISQITDWLFLGSLSDALDRELLNRHGITYILNVAKECESGDSPSDHSCSSGEDTPGSQSDSKFTYAKLDVVDHADEAIGSVFHAAFRFLEKARLDGAKVLVHCRRGISRSATLVIAYLMKYQNMGLNEAFEHVQHRRSIINPNLGFVMSLETFDKSLKAPNSAVDVHNPGIAVTS
eukprot:Sspe_Gene.89625::Locus_61356_Transcript_1_2_Confidence_0.750_Length_891::g.89625::m.89625/K21278/DUSP1; dual specificity protein phosphatase 1